MIALFIGILIHIIVAVGATEKSVQRISLVISEGETTLFGRRILVNGTSPGPIISVWVGRPVEVSVINLLPEQRRTTIHFHGVDQFNSPFSDGIINVTQCSVPNSWNAKVPKEFKLSFIPREAGTFWYHGHFSEQYVDGLHGAFIVQSPLDEPVLSSLGAPYELDGPPWIWVVSDYFAVNGSTLLKIPDVMMGEEPTPDSYIVNGRMSRNWTMFAPSDQRRGVRVRVINAAAMAVFTLSIDGLPLRVVELDGTLIHPKDVRSISLNVGQRVSFVLDFRRLSQLVDKSPSVFVRFTGSRHIYPGDGMRGTAKNESLRAQWKGRIILRQKPMDLDCLKSSWPNYTSIPFIPYPSPREINFLDARPVKQRLAPEPTHFLPYVISFRENGFGKVVALINGATALSNWSHATADYPILYRLFLEKPPKSRLKIRNERRHLRYRRKTAGNMHTNDGGDVGFDDDVAQTLPIITGDGQTPFVVPANAVVDVLINNTDNGEHPIHLHGHQFFIISTNQYPEAEYLYSYNYLLRDTVSVPANGWAKLRFIADNPGVWMFHCHIDWHMSAGFMSHIIEAPEVLYEYRKSYIRAIPNEQLDSCRPDVVSKLRSLIK